MSFTNSWIFLKLMSIELVMPSNHLILCHPLLFLPSVFPSIRVFSSDPMDCSSPGSSIHGIFQARVLEWVAVSFSRGSSPPRDRTQVSHIAIRCFYHLSHKGSSLKLHYVYAIATCELLGVAHKAILKEWVLKSNPVVFSRVYIRSLKRYWSLDPTPWAN